MKLTKTKLKQIIKEEIAGLVSEGERHPDEPWSDKSLEALAYDQTAINTVKDALEKGIKALLEKWPDKKHPYFIDLMNLYQQSGGE
jgi:hypothetical protein